MSRDALSAVLIASIMLVLRTLSAPVLANVCDVRELEMPDEPMLVMLMNTVLCAGPSASIPIALAVDVTFVVVSALGLDIALGSLPVPAAIDTPTA